MKRILTLLFCFVGLVHADLSLFTECHLFDYFIWEPSNCISLGRNMSRCRCLWGIISISFGSVSILHFTLSRISI